VRASVVLVVTEHASHLTVARRRRYEAIGRHLAEIAGRDVRTVHYLDADALAADAVVLSGAKAPWAAHEPDDLARLGEAVTASGRPTLGICAGLQLLTMFAGGEVRPMRESGREPERGYLPLQVLDGAGLLEGLSPRATVFQDHEDEITVLPDGFRVLARTAGCEVQAVADPERGWWGTQFHPERSDAEHPDGPRVLENFFALASGR
jgi:GMP synthase (glutamine-hydrolysing)